MYHPYMLRQGLIWLFLLPFSQVLATSWSVTTSGDTGPGTLREQISLAGPGDTITFAIADSIVLSSQLQLDTHLYLIGPPNRLQVISGGGQNRIFAIGQGDSVLLQNLEIRNGSAFSYVLPGGGAIANEGFLDLRRCYFHHNEAGYGGAIACGKPGIVSGIELTDCTFAYNTALNPGGNPNQAPQGGGAIYADGNMMGAVDINAFNCTFAHNRAGLAGGAVYLLGNFITTNQTSFECTNCTLVYNEATESGALGYFDSPVFRFTNSILAENNAFTPNLDGTLLSFGHNLIDPSIGIFFATMGQADSTDILDQSAKIGMLGWNGGLVPTVPIACSSPAIDQATVIKAPLTDQRGRTRQGNPDIGAYEFDEIADVQVSSLAAQGPGSLSQAVLLACPDDTLDLGSLQGTIYLNETIVFDKSLSLLGNPQNQIRLHGNDSVRLMEIHSGNTVSLRWFNLEHGGPENYGGGAILNKGTLTLEASTLAFNQALSGGAIGNYGESDTARLFATNCTFAHNVATALDGGAIDNRFIQHPAFAELIHCTMADNRALDKGGAIYNDPLTELILQNTLLAHNQGAEGPDVWGQALSQGPNLLTNAQGLVLTSTFADLLDVSLTLDPLFSYGGPTPTYRLPAGSPAIDAALNLSQPTTDQRGAPRIFNATADIGAYEYDPATTLEESLFERGVQLQPNPNQGQFSLRFPPDYQGWAQIWVSDLQGQTVLQQSVQVQAATPLPFFLNDLPQGLYTLRIQSDQLGLQTLKLLIR